MSIASLLIKKTHLKIVEREEGGVWGEKKIEIEG